MTKDQVRSTEEALSLEQTLRLALEALEEYCEHGAIFMPITVRDAIKATLLSRSDGEANDEPVLWRNAAIRLGEELSSVGPNGYYDMDAKEWLDWAMEQNPRGEHSLLHRTWVGLTDEEIAEALGDEIDSVYMTDFRRVEAKLKEKNT